MFDIEHERDNGGNDPHNVAFAAGVENGINTTPAMVKLTDSMGVCGTCFVDGQIIGSIVYIMKSIRRQTGDEAAEKWINGFIEEVKEIEKRAVFNKEDSQGGKEEEGE